MALAPEFAFDAVHSFEPDPKCVARIERDFATAIAAGRLCVDPVALGAEDREITLFGDNAGGGASIVAGMLSDDGRATRVARWTLRFPRRPCLRRRYFRQTEFKAARLKSSTGCIRARISMR